MARVVHFEIHAENPERAVAFYRNVFGWDIQAWEGGMPYWIVRTGPDDQPGINGGLLVRRGPAPAEGQPVNAYVCTLALGADESIDATLARVEAHGGTMAMPKMPVPGVGQLAYCKDTEGNIFGVLQPEQK